MSFFSSLKSIFAYKIKDVSGFIPLLIVITVSVSLKINPFSQNNQNFYDDIYSDDAAAKKYIGDIFYQGQGVEINKLAAEKWYLKAANQGDPEAQYALAKMLIIGDGIPQDIVSAIAWLNKSAEQGNPQAQNMLGDCYYKSFGVPGDHITAFNWYQKAAIQGLAEAQKNAALMYFMGYGNLSEAITFLQSAASKGIPDAQSRLGLMYENGEGVPKDISKALYWYYKAANQHDSQAKNRLQTLHIE